LNAELKKKLELATNDLNIKSVMLS